MSFAAFFIFSMAIFHCQAAYYDNYNYCQLPCNYGLRDITHVICEKRGDCSVDTDRCPGYERVVMTDKIKAFIIDEHNKLRNRIANGEEHRGYNGSQPPAANMRALKYNDELAHVALCWANTCQLSTHSKCHRTKRLPYAGQNLAYRQSTAKNFETLEASIKKMISSWYEEVTSFNPRYIQPYRFFPGTGHYTLMVWGNIQEVGCGIVRFRNGIWHTIHMVCNYGSTEIAGNVIGKSMYQIGQPLSRCPSGTDFNIKYNGLCGNDTLDLTDRLYYSRPAITRRTQEEFLQPQRKYDVEEDDADLLLKKIIGSYYGFLGD